MNTPMPIIIPVQREPNKCPSCGNIENKKVVCRLCGHEYKEENLGDGRIIAIVFGAVVTVVLGMMAVLTIFDWVSGTPLFEAIAKMSKAFHYTITNIW